jgi:glutaredoxin
MYQELEKFLKQTEIWDKIDMEFIDIKQDDTSKYDKEMKVLKTNNQLPITFIGGKPAFSGKVDNFRTYLLLKKINQ